MRREIDSRMVLAKGWRARTRGLYCLRGRKSQYYKRKGGHILVAPERECIQIPLNYMDKNG